EAPCLPTSAENPRKGGAMKMLNSLIPKAWANDMPRSLFRGLFDLDRDLDTLFESGGTWWPAVEARTKDGELVLRCDLPGVDPSDIEVSLEGTTLTISGERRSEREEKEEGRRFSEVRYGRFERSLTVPDGIDREKVTARYENGVLEVTVPLPAGHASRRVPIQIESHGSKKAACGPPRGGPASRSDRPSGGRARDHSLA